MMNGHTLKNRYPSRLREIGSKAKHVGRVVAFLTREQIDFVDKISKDALFSTGKKLSRTAVIQSIIEAARKLNLSGKGVHTPDQLEERMQEVAKQGLTSLADALKKGIEKDKEKKEVKANEES